MGSFLLHWTVTIFQPPLSSCWMEESWISCCYSQGSSWSSEIFVSLYLSPMTVSSGILSFMKCTQLGSKYFEQSPESSLASVKSWQLDKSVSRFSLTWSQQTGLARSRRKTTAPFDSVKMERATGDPPRWMQPIRPCMVAHWGLYKSQGGGGLLPIQDSKIREGAGVVNLLAGHKAWLVGCLAWLGQKWWKQASLSRNLFLLSFGTNAGMADKH